MQIISILHSSEKPCDLREIKIPFQNTDQLQDIKKEMIFQISKMKGDKDRSLSSKKTVNETVKENMKINYANSQMYKNLFGGTPTKVNIFSSQIYNILYDDNNAKKNIF